jgi:UDP-N-acetylmuramoyl-L-alanyl-D-glutamate--2,6-diaminopimelate ligase
MEDRYSAIRAAIGTAGEGDVVLLAGKGHEDWVEHADESGEGLLVGWLDDRCGAGRRCRGRAGLLAAAGSSGSG